LCRWPQRLGCLESHQELPVVILFFLLFYQVQQYPYINGLVFLCFLDEFPQLFNGFLVFAASLLVVLFL